MLKHFFRVQLTRPLWIALCFCALFKPVGAETLYFAPLPMEEPEVIIKQFKPMLTYLEQRLGVTIEIRYASSYSETLERIQKGEIDLAYLGPLPYIILREKFPEATPLVHFLENTGLPTYTCALISAGDPLPKKISGKTFALTQPLSTCGYLATDGLLKNVKSTLSDNKFRYVDKHDEVALSIARGDYQFGGIKTAIAKKYAHLGIKILAETKPLPSFALIANGKKVSAARQTEIRGLLTTLQPAGADKALLSTWGSAIKNGSIPAKDGDYDEVKQLRRSAHIPMQGNF